MRVCSVSACLIFLASGCQFDAGVNLGPVVDPNIVDSGETEADGAVPVVATCPGDPALVVCHQFEDSLADSSNYGNDATGQNHFFAPGIAGRALSANSETEVTIADAPSLRFGPDAMTLEAWVLPQEIPAGDARVGVVDQDGGPSIFIYGGGDVRCFAGDRRVAAGPGTIAVDAWVHLACTHASGTTIIYANGRPVLTEGNGGSITPGTIGMAIAGDSPSGAPLVGRVDNLRVWVVARTDEQICEAANRTDC